MSAGRCGTQVSRCDKVQARQRLLPGSARPTVLRGEAGAGARKERQLY